MLEGREAGAGEGRATDHQVDLVSEREVSDAQLDEEIARRARRDLATPVACRAEARAETELDRQRIELRLGGHIGEYGVGRVERELPRGIGGVPRLADVGEHVEPVGDPDLQAAVDVGAAGVLDVEPDGEPVALLAGELEGPAAAHIGAHAPGERVERGADGAEHELVIAQVRRACQRASRNVVRGRRGRNAGVERHVIDREPAHADDRVIGLARLIGGVRILRAVDEDLALVDQLGARDRSLHGDLTGLLSGSRSGRCEGERSQR